MNKFSIRFMTTAIVLYLLLSVGACSEKNKSQSSTQEPKSISNDWIENATAWTDSVMQMMTLEEMVGQLFMPASYASSDYFTIKQLVKYVADNHVGGIVFLKGDIESQKMLSDTLRSFSEIPMFIAIDAEWGLGMRLKDAPVYPMNGRLGRLNDEQLMYEYGHEVARQSREVGINMILSPVLDVVDKSVKNAIGNRSFGDDPRKVAELAVAYARGMEDGNVMSVGKHFPGHGSAMGDSHHVLPKVYRDKFNLDSIDFFPFRAYSDAGLSAIMVGHLYVPSIDKIERSSAISPVVTTDYLKNTIGFEGLVLTDAINMKGATGSTRLGLQALIAGADIVLAPENTSQEIRDVIDAVLKGELSIDSVKNKCRRILMYKYRFAYRTANTSENASDSLRMIKQKELLNKLRDFVTY